MGRTACTEPQCLYKGALYLFLLLDAKRRDLLWGLPSRLFGWHWGSFPGCKAAGSCSWQLYINEWNLPTLLIGLHGVQSKNLTLLLSSISE
jgi:hypothetical protein